MTTYLMAGGGTAGHVNPLLAVATRIRDQEPESSILVLGTKEGLEARLVPAQGFELLTIERLPFPRKPGKALVAFPGRQRAAIAAVREIIRERKVDVVVGFGGYASAPAYLAARAEKIPFVIHEANAKPGLANRLGSRYTDFVGVAHANTRIRHAEFVGMPLRREIEQLDRAAARIVARAFFGLDADKPVLLVTGGSSGARSINSTISRSAAILLGTGWQVLHIAGARAEVSDPELPGYVFLNYCDRMDFALAIADLAVSRSGSATVSELSAVGVAAVYIPYPVGNGEQRFNAHDVVAAGGAIIVKDADFTPDWVSTSLVPLMQDRAAIAEMAARALSVGVLDGTDRMVDLVHRALHRPDAPRQQGNSRPRKIDGNDQA